MDVATLGLRIENGQIVAADQSLQKLTGSAGRAEKSAVSLRGAFAAIGGYVVAREFFAMAAATREAELAQVRLEGVLNATGNRAGFTATQLDALANQMSRNTLFDDEAIKNAAARLATFGNVVGDVFSRALSLGGDLATLTGGDITESMAQLGRALEDPVRGVQLLTRAGIALSDAQREAVRTAVQHNEVARAQGIILDALQAKVGGLAQGSHVGLTGSIHDLRLEWGNLLEAFGQTPGIAMTVANAIALIADAVAGFMLTISPTLALLEENLREQRAGVQRKFDREVAQGYDPTRGATADRAREIAELTNRIDALRASAVAAMHASGVAAHTAAAVTLTAVTEGEDAEKELRDLRLAAQQAAISGLEEIANRQHEATQATVDWQHAMADAADAAEGMSAKTVAAIKHMSDAADAYAEKLRRGNIDAIKNGITKGGDGSFLGVVGSAIGSGSLGGLMQAIPGLEKVGRFAAQAFDVLKDALFGSAQASREMTEASNAAADLASDYIMQLNRFRVEVRGNNPEAVILELQERITKLMRNMTSAQQDELRKLYAERVKQIREEFALKKQEAMEDYGLRSLRAQGRNDEADAMELAYKQQREMAQAIRDGADAATQAALAEAQFAEKMQIAGDKIRATIAGLKSTIEGLNAFQLSLKFGAGSTASPMVQYAAARAEYQKTLAAAMGGDQSAAGRLPEIARAFLDISRQVNASGVAFQRDQQDVVDAVDAVTAMFQGQLDVQQRMLDALGEGGPIVGTMLKTFDGTVAVLTAGFTEQSSRLERLIAATESGNTKVSRMLEGAGLAN